MTRHFDHANTSMRIFSNGAVKFAHSITRASQTIRKNYCLTGEAFGIRPIKIGSRLLWPVNDIAQLLANGRKK